MFLPQEPEGAIQSAEDTVDKLADDLELLIIGVGELVGYDYEPSAGMLKLIAVGDNADRLARLVLSLVRTVKPRRGSYYTVEPLMDRGNASCQTRFSI